MRKITLSEDEVPKQWYNILSDLPKLLLQALKSMGFQPYEMVLL